VTPLFFLLSLAAVAAAGAPRRASTDAERAATVARCRRVLLGMGWRHPFFLPAVARVQVVADDSIPTACAERRGCIRVNPHYIGTGVPGTPGLNDAQVGFVMGHELLHLILCHWSRRMGRPMRRWNKATDRAINQALRDSGITPPPDVLFPAQGQERFTAEEHYAGEPEEDEGDQGGQGQGPSEPGKGCGPVDGPPGPDGADADGAGADRAWRETEQQCRALDRTAGQGKGSAVSRLTDIPPAKVAWKAILRRALSIAVAEAGTDDVSWSRRSRRSASLPGIPVLPGGICTRARIAVVIDTSGSMSDADLSRCVGETVAILTQAKVGAYLVVHDHEVQHALWLKPRDTAPAVAARMTGRSGTRFAPAYDQVGAERGPRFGAMVHLTDGEGETPWPEKPVNVRHAIAAIVGRPGAETHAPQGFRTVEVEP